jgi:protein PhnA
MSLSRFPALVSFFSSHLPDGDPSGDPAAAEAFAASSADRARQAASQARELLEGDLPLEDLGSEANRWFGDQEEARAWLKSVAEALERAGGGGAGGSGDVVVKDSNGAPLAEGDSVLVIKDLKVKGGSSDLKRGTLIRKIHLIGDPDNIECRVDGSTLVLKTMFLKKA